MGRVGAQAGRPLLGQGRRRDPGGCGGGQATNPTPTRTPTSSAERERGCRFADPGGLGFVHQPGQRIARRSQGLRRQAGARPRLVQAPRVKGAGGRPVGGAGDVLEADRPAPQQPVEQRAGGLGRQHGRLADGFLFQLAGGPQQAHDADAFRAVPGVDDGLYLARPGGGQEGSRAQEEGWGGAAAAAAAAVLVG